MIRLASLVVFATFLACVLAQTTTTEPAATTDSTTTERPTTAVPPTQKPQGPRNYSFDANNKVCLRLVVSMNLTLWYHSDSGNKQLFINLNNIADVDEDNSSCHDEPQVLSLSFDILGEEGDPQYLMFKFHKDKDGNWNASDVLYSFKPSSFPPDLDLNITDDPMITLPAIDHLMELNIDVGGSYICSNEQNLTFDSTSIEQKINATLSISDLQVQAYIEEKANGQFGSSRDCNASSKGNKIVPIAVGAALAGLVIVVLIAYLIGRLKSRRQSSYEALS